MRLSDMLSGLFVYLAGGKQQGLEIELQGGSPWFAYIWIDDVCYTIRKNKYVSLSKTK